MGGPSSHFCVVLLFCPLSFRVVLLGVVMLSHRSLVWRFFPFLGGAVFFFWVVLLSPFFWVLLLSLSRPSFQGYCLVFFFVGVASSLNTCGCAALPSSSFNLVLLSSLGWRCLLLPLFLGGVAFSLFALPAGGALPPSLFSLALWVVLLGLLLLLVVLPSSLLIRVVLISPSPPATIKLASRGQSTQVTTDRQHTFCLALERERELLTSIGRSLHEFPLCVSPETFFWTANLQRVVATSSSERSEGGRLGEAETLTQFQAFLDKKILPAEERVRCVRLVEVWNIVKSPRHPSLVLACPHEQIQDEDGIGEETVKKLDKRTSGSNQLTVRFFFLGRPKSS